MSASPSRTRLIREGVARRAGAAPGQSAYASCAHCGTLLCIDWEPGCSPKFTAVGEGEGGHLDHLIPRSQGGPDSLDNVVLACVICNLARGDAAIGDGTFQSWLGGRRWQVYRELVEEHLALEERSS